MRLLAVLLTQRAWQPLSALAAQPLVVLSLWMPSARTMVSPLHLAVEALVPQALPLLQQQLRLPLQLSPRPQPMLMHKLRLPMDHQQSASGLSPERTHAQERRPRMQCCQSTLTSL